MVQEQVSDRLLLVGTAHVSPQSVLEVQAAIRDFKPDVVAVELDPLRLDALENKQKWESTPIHRLIKSDRLWLFLTQILLSSYQRRLGEEYGAEPGAEMLVAVQSARAAGHEVLLADRDVGVTMKRAFRAMKWGEKWRLSWEVMKSLVGAEGEPEEEPETIDETGHHHAHASHTRKVVANLWPLALAILAGSGILYLRDRPEFLWWPALLTGVVLLAATFYLWVFEKYHARRAAASSRPQPTPPPRPTLQDMTKEDAVTAMMQELGAYAPSIKRVVIDERDIYIASKVQAPLDAGKRVVAVVGAGHLPGIRERIRSGRGATDLAPLETVPSKGFSVWGFVLQWLLPFTVVALLVYFAWEGFRTGNWTKLRDAALMWILVTGSFAALGALLGRGHPAAIATAFVAAPITTLHPALAAGWFAGLAEAWVRTPTVLDFQSLSRIKRAKDFFDNRVIRVVMVTALANVGASVGFFIASYQVWKIFQGA